MRHDGQLWDMAEWVRLGDRGFVPVSLEFAQCCATKGVKDMESLGPKQGEAYQDPEILKAEHTPQGHGEIVAYLQATAPRLAIALTRERMDLIEQIVRNRGVIQRVRDELAGYDAINTQSVDHSIGYCVHILDEILNDSAQQAAKA